MLSSVSRSIANLGYRYKQRQIDKQSQFDPHPNPDEHPPFTQFIDVDELPPSQQNKDNYLSLFAAKEPPIAPPLPGKTNLPLVGDLDQIMNQNQPINPDQSIVMSQSIFQLGKQKISRAFNVTKYATKFYINAYIDKAIDKTTLSIEKKVMAQLTSQSMPNLVKDFVTETFEYVWNNSKNLLKQETHQFFFNDSYVIFRQTPEGWMLLKPWYLFRNWLLYLILPYDKSIWLRMTKPQWWVVTIMFYMPYYGIQTFMYLIMFLAIDKSETFQLVNFILTYKNSQFFTTGCLNIFYGYIAYFFCADLLPNIRISQISFSTQEIQELNRYLQLQLIDHEDQQDHVYHLNPYQLLSKQVNNADCIQYGPDSSVSFRWEFGSYIIQFLMVWFAFYMIRYSQSLSKLIGLVLYQDFTPQPSKETDEKGGRLRSFLVYDLYCFVATLLIFSFLFFKYYNYGLAWNMMNYASISGLMFFTRVLYGLLSLPFILFLFQTFVTLFTSARPTAYDPYIFIVTYGNLIFLQGSSGIQLAYRKTEFEAMVGNLAETIRLPDTLF